MQHGQLPTCRWTIHWVKPPEESSRPPAQRFRRRTLDQTNVLWDIILGIHIYIIYILYIICMYISIYMHTMHSCMVIQPWRIVSLFLYWECNGNIVGISYGIYQHPTIDCWSSSMWSPVQERMEVLGKWQTLLNIDSSIVLPSLAPRYSVSPSTSRKFQSRPLAVPNGHTDGPQK